ncbi:hypothetical protein [Corynebacterium sp. KPL1824]|uniref:hypothetical protein n=1 Tax=Corynebacterium sp. KPL1824 TaxID=1203561 RepID=UPI00041685A6|nr:hypothetical protein [Corynebacterium sp. KPL1824]
MVVILPVGVVRSGAAAFPLGAAGYGAVPVLVGAVAADVVCFLFLYPCCATEEVGGSAVLILVGEDFDVDGVSAFCAGEVFVSVVAEH